MNLVARKRVPATCLVVLLFAACSADSSEYPLPCPSSWTTEEEPGCHPTTDYLAELESTIGTGVYGYATITTGGCSPRCMHELVPKLELAVYKRVDVTTGAVGACLRAFEVIGDADPVLVMLSDEEGQFEGSLEYGSYAVTTKDPFDQCPFFAGSPEVTRDAPLIDSRTGFSHGVF